jgi:hypothetical protein
LTASILLIFLEVGAAASTTIEGSSSTIVNDVPVVTDVMPPIFPMCLYGTVWLNGETAPDDTTIQAQIDGEVRGSTVVKAGKYGENAWNRLIINGDVNDQGRTIQFYVDSILADENFPWHSGDVEQVDLYFNSNSIFNVLKEADSFHPPDAADPRKSMYNEWHYFNFIDEEQNLSFMTILKVNGDVSDSAKSLGTVLVTYETSSEKILKIDSYPITLVNYSNNSPNLQISNSSVTFTEEGYNLHIESNDTMTVFDGTFVPLTEPAPIQQFSLSSRSIAHWLVASSKMRVNGNLTINRGTDSEYTYIVNNARGYHDHNWGFWLWQDDIGWDWGQLNTQDGNDSSEYTFTFGNVTNRNHTESLGSVLFVWKNQKIISIFRNEEIWIRHYQMTDPVGIPPDPNKKFPLMTVIEANSGGNSMTISFTAENITPILLPYEIETGFTAIWELTGTYDVQGFLDGKAISYRTHGFQEYVV